MKQYRYFIASLLISILAVTQQTILAKDFVVVIDAGHGGNDPGAVGLTAKEKHINLSVALKLGKLIEENCKDTRVVYTRKRDVFIPLDRRAEIANNAKADLFISIHTNALAKNRTATGASTWTLGLAKSDANLDVAKRENAVILYESDYQTRYAGFNPNSAESYIIFEFMQDRYMEQSVHLATLVQKQFKQTCRRADRGVHQAGFLVLKASAMPSILVELGFISTPSEEKYLNTDAGANNMANGIYRAFLSYKREHELRLNGSSQTIVPEGPIEEARTEETEKDKPTKNKDTEKTERRETEKNQKAEKTKKNEADIKVGSHPVFKIQILTANKKLNANDSRLKGLKGVDYYREGSTYKYTYGASTDYNQVLRTKRQIASKFKDCFIIAFQGDKKMNVQEAIRDFKNRKRN